MDQSAGEGLTASPLHTNFLSLLVFRNGDIYCDPQNTDSHEALIDARGLRDTDSYLTGFVRAKYAPESIDELVDVTKYRLITYEDNSVAWWDDVKDITERKCRHRINRMMVSDRRRILLGGCWIIAEGAHILRVINGRIIYMGGGIVKYIKGGSIDYYQAGLIKHWIDHEGNEIQTKLCLSR